jgi:hypothetical protein
MGDARRKIAKAAEEMRLRLTMLIRFTNTTKTIGIKCH